MFAFDLDDGDFLFGSGNNRFDLDGHMMHHMGGNMAMDMDIGDFILYPIKQCFIRLKI